MKFSFFILLFSFFVIAGSTKEMKDDFGKSNATTSVSILSLKQAETLFKQFKTQEQIPFDYPIDGCYARATEMAKIAEKENIQMGKVYAEGFLRAKIKHPFLKTVEWGWHVAPVAYVQSGDKVELMVFDPSLFDHPVSELDWITKMSESGIPEPEITKVYHGSRFQYQRLGKEKQKKSWYSDDLKSTKETMENYHLLMKRFKTDYKDYYNRTDIEQQQMRRQNSQQRQWGIQ